MRVSFKPNELNLKLLFAVWMGALGLTIASALAAPPAGGTSKPPVVAAAATDDGSVARRLKAAIGESQARLGELEPWQKKIFDEEALPQYQRFVRNYRSAQTHSGTAVSNLEVDIDMDSLKNYLRFYAPKTLGRDAKNSTALVYLRSDDSCEKCLAAGPAIRKLAQMRFERRGLTPVWLSSEDLGANADSAELSGKALDDKIAELASARNSAAALVMQWGLAPAEDVDSAHADEKHYVLHSLLLARGLAGTGQLAASAQATARTEGKVDLLDSDAFDVSAGRLLSDAFVELGAQAQQAELAAASKGGGAGGDESEIDVDITGIHDFLQLSRIKAQIQAKLATAVVEERKISRGRVVLALLSEKAAPEVVRAKLAGLSVDPTPGSGAGRLVPLEPNGTAPASVDGLPTITMEIRL